MYWRKKSSSSGYMLLKGILRLYSFLSVSVSRLVFLWGKYVVFNDSKMKGRVQLFRYFMICMFNLVLNYILLKIFVERFHIYAVIAQILTTSIVIRIQLCCPKAFFFQARCY
ncbi:MAG: GtrA family protein [Bacteroidota bacterium]